MDYTRFYINNEKSITDLINNLDGDLDSPKNLTARELAQNIYENSKKGVIYVNGTKVIAAQYGGNFSKLKDAIFDSKRNHLPSKGFGLRMIHCSGGHIKAKKRRDNRIMVVVDFSNVERENKTDTA